MKKVLITGASGFIGSFLVKEALDRGYEVYAGVRPTSSRQYLDDSRIKFIELHFVDTEKLIDQLLTLKQHGTQFDYVIHNAGITKAKTIHDFFTVNCRYTCNLADALVAAHCVPAKFVYISSLAAFGPRSDQTPIRHSDIPQPITSYGRSKLDTEKYLQPRL
jgi:nucleoside-diphosphate-sugar epimerase